MAVYVSDLLTATPAPVDATPASTRTWQWLRGSTNISGATSAAYTTTTADIGSPIYATQLETNFLGTTRATSAATETVQAFDPIRLFSASEPGVWFDPNDITTLFKGPSAIAQVAAPGDTVWTMLDKSQGGPGPELILNGTFDTNIANWTLSAVATATVSPSGVTVTNNGLDGQGLIRQTITSVVGRTYKLQLDITSAGRSRIAGTGGFFLTQAIRNGTFSVLAVATGTTLTLDLIAFDGTGGVVTFDNVSVKEVPGNHAVQATTASQPTYGIVPAGGLRNQITFSEQFDNAVWTKTAATIDVNAIAAPNGTMTADKIAETAVLTSHSVAPPAFLYAAGTQYTYSVYVKAAERTWLLLQFASTPFGGSTRVWFNLTAGVTGFTQNCTPVITPVGDGWYRCSITATTTVGGAQSSPVVTCATTADSVTAYTGVLGFGIYVWGAQLELSASPTAYQRVGTQYDVTEAGVASLGYLWFDGLSNFMSTPTITPGTDKVQVFSGVRKLSDAAIGLVLETSANINNNNGSIALGAPGTASTNYRFLTKGTLIQQPTAPLFAAPTTNVLTGLSDIGGDLASIRVDGTEIAQTTGDQGTGDYLAYPMYIGYRNATASLYFSGQLYPLIARFGPNLTAARISATESWVASQTAGVVIP